MKKIFIMSLAAVLSLSLLAGCTGKDQNETPTGGQTGTPSVTRPASDYVGGPTGGKPAQKVEVNFEGVVAAVEDDTITLADGKIIVITDETSFASDPDSDRTISDEIAVGNYIQGYTTDDANADKVTASNIWTNDAPTTGGKMAVNFEGRVAAVEDGKVTLEEGTVILTDGADIAAPDGSAGKISAGDYIQGYAEDPDAAELNATAILITVL